MKQLLIVVMIVFAVGLAGCSSNNVSEETLEQVKQDAYSEGYSKGYDQGILNESDKSKTAIEEAAKTESENGTELEIDTPYYTITFPESWRDTYTYEYQDGFIDSPTAHKLRGYMVTVKNKADEKILFTICCAEDSYPGVGNGQYEIEIGRTSIDPQYRIMLGRMLLANVGEMELGYGNGSAFGADRNDEYINYITIK